MNRIVSVIIIIFYFISSEVSAQNIEGHITDKNRRPISFANVILFYNDTTFICGTISDTTGYFKISLNSPIIKKQLKLKISSIGYKTETLNIISYEPKNITLTEETLRMNEVVIYGNNDIYTMNKGGIIINITKSGLKNIGNAFKVMERLPNIYMESGKIQIFGKGAPLIYVDNKKLDDYSELERINSSNIVHIEIITNPGAEYPANTNGIIKIKTKKETENALGMEFNSFFQQAKKSSLQEMIRLNYHHNKIDVFGTLSYTNYSQIQNYDNTHKVLKGYTLDASSRLHNRTKKYYIKTGFDFYCNKDNSFGANYSLTYNDVIGYSEEDLLVNMNKERSDNQLYFCNYGNTSPISRANIYYSGKIGQVTLDFNSNLYSQSRDENQKTYAQSKLFDSQMITTDNIQKNTIFATQLKTTYKKGETTIVNGLEYNQTERTNDYTNFENLISSQTQSVKQKKYAAFVSYSTKLNIATFDLGLRYEYMKMDYHRKHSGNSDLNKKYSNIYPNISVSIPINKWYFNFSISQKTKRPSYNQLDGNIEYVSRYIYKSGNIALEPENIFNCSLIAKYKKLLLSLDYIQNKNTIINTYSVYDNSDNILLSHYENYDKADIFNLGITYYHKLGIWTPQVGWNMSISNYNLFSDKIKFNSPYNSFTFNNSIELRDDWTIDIYARYRTKGYDGVFYRKNSFLFSLNIIKSWEKFHLDVLFNDIFSTSKDKYELRTNICQYLADGYRDSQNIQVTFKYYFKQIKSKYKGKSIDNSEIERL